MNTLLIGGLRDGRTVNIPLAEIAPSFRTDRTDQAEQTETYEATVMTFNGLDEKVLVVQGMSPAAALERFNAIRSAK